MDGIVKAAQSISYSNKDILNLLDGKVNILTYPDLSEYKTLESIFAHGGGVDCVCILYMTKDNYGHWTALLRNTGGEECYEVFDSYGLFPDAELDFISPEYRLESNQYRKHLSSLLLNELNTKPEIPIYFNKYELQSKDDYHKQESINTCGRWCGLRCLLRRFNIKEFISLFINQLMPMDMIVTYLTLINR